MWVGAWAQHRAAERPWAAWLDWDWASFPAEYREAVDRYRLAFMRALPHLSQDDVVWRMYFFVGIVAYAMAGKDLMRMTETYALADAGEPEAIMARLRPFVVAGFLAAPGGLSTGLATP